MAAVPFSVTAADSVVALIREGAGLKNRIAADRIKLADINLKLDELAVFPQGKSIAHLAGAGYAVTVQRKQNVKWNQAALENVRASIGNEAFFKVFEWEFKPASAKALSGFLEFGDSEQTTAVRAAMTIAQATPYITYKPLEETQEGM